MRGRGILLTGIGLCLTAAAAIAAPRVTIVLKNGERVTGSLVYHQDTNINLIVNGNDEAFPYDDIAVIEFVGGTPSAAELDRLPRTDRPAELQRDMIAFKDGHTVHGKLHDVIDDAETISFDAGRGDRQRYASRDIARMYCNGGAARGVYHVAPAPPTPAPPPPKPAAEQDKPLPGSIRIEATRDWTDTGVAVKKGQRVAFEAVGTIYFGADDNMKAGPDGSAAVNARQRRGLPVPEMGIGGLVGRVDEGEPFPIGSNTNPIVMPATGRVYLGVNDGNLDDNTGFFRVKVTRQR
jgi:hypothetical protein